jgi:NADPH-dependent 2,4-dienoyl-CoA reductase/sulfur reductase-like enzyme
MNRYDVDVLIVGAGPAGLSAAIELLHLGIKNVVVVDRDPVSGGTPRLCDHTGFGLRDLHRLYTGPGYADRYSSLAKKAGVQIKTNTTILEWSGDNKVLATSPDGLSEIQAKAVLLATGCRERPRAARLVPGYRPAGIYTTGALQDFVHGYHQHIGNRAVIVGAELVSFSAIMTLREAGCKIVRMVTDHLHHQVFGFYTGYKWWTANILQHVPISTRCQIAEIHGLKRVQSVTVRNLDSGAVESIPCDTVIFSGDWIPESELARKGGLTMAAGSKGPLVDAYYRTLKPGVFAAGNLLRGAETADIAALEGRKAATAIHSYLGNGKWSQACISIQHDANITWIVPTVVNNIEQHGSSRPILFRVKTFSKNARVRVQQGDRLLHEQSFGKLGPNYSFALANSWLGNVQVPGPEIQVSLAS